MDEENPPPNRPYRMRRPSTSLISSTTSAPPQGPLQPPPSPMAHHSRRSNNSNGAIVHSNNFAPGDIDDDSPSSSSSFTSPSLRHRGGASSSFSRNGPPSPLSSPDSTYYGAAPSPSPYSYRGPATPGGMCVVSSSTVDDVPPSPFSPAEEVSNSGQNGPNGSSVLVSSLAAAPGPSGAVHNRISQLIVGSASSGGSGSSANSQQHSVLISQLNQDVRHINQEQPAPMASSSQASAQGPPVSISPLRNKIKKASSFERFSQQAASSGSANRGGTGANPGAIVANENSLAAASVPAPVVPQEVISIQQQPVPSPAPQASTSAIVSRVNNWEPVITTASVVVPQNSSSAMTSSTMSSFRSSQTNHFGGASHIKIPSKKLAAKIASVFEQQEQMNEASASMSNVIIPPSSSIVSSLSQTLNQPPLQSSSSVVQSYQGSSSTSTNSTLTQILNEAPSHHLAGLINAAEDQIMNHHTSHHQLSSQPTVSDSLIRELSESPLNLTDNSTSHHSSHLSQQSRNPVIASSRAPTTSTSTSLTITKKIPLTPKQKLLHRAVHGAMSPPPEPPQQIHPQMASPLPQASVLSISHPQSPPHVSNLSQQLQQASISTALIQSTSTLQSMPLDTLPTSQASVSSHLILSNNGAQSPQLDAYSYDALLRAREDLAVQEAIGKIIEDPNNVSNMQYDNPETYAYYQTFFNDPELFNGTSAGTSQMAGPSSRQLQDPNELAQQQGHHSGQIEFVLGLQDDHVRGRPDDLSLGNDGNGQQQFLDPNDALAMKAHGDSTLRNLLMMDGNRHVTNEEAWLLQEYQNRNPLTDFSSQRRSNIGGGNGNGAIMNLNISNNGSVWSNDNNWQRQTGWTHHQDQDEVMDMSMIEPDKSGGTSSVVVTKRFSHTTTYSQDSMDDVNLDNGLLQNMPISMPMDLQQPLGILQSTSGGSTLKNTLMPSNSAIPMDLQQHHKIMSVGQSATPIDMDDQPVNLMAVNLEQELHHHSSHHHSSHGHSHILPHHLAEVKQQSSAGLDHSNQYAIVQSHLQDQSFHHSSHLVDVSSLSPALDNIDERRVIRVKKLIPQEENNTLPPPNIIPDKPIQPKSHASLPAPLQLVSLGNANNDLAVYTRNKSIPANTRFGPVEGSLKKACAEDMNTMNAVYPCLIISDSSNILWRVDRDDDDCCNWTKFVRMAHSIKDQNALVSEGEHDGMLYFTTCKEIQPRTELQVGFSLEYAQKYGLPYLLPVNGNQGPPLQETSYQQSTSGGVIHGGQSFMHSQRSDEEIVNHHSHHVHNMQENVQMAPLQHQPQLATTPTPPPPPVEPQPLPQKSVIVESYQCFECEQEFPEVAMLQEHLDTLHKEPEIRRPKKKAIKKYQQQLQQQQQNSAVSTSNPAQSVVAQAPEPMNILPTREEVPEPGPPQQHEKIDSSSQINTIDSSDLLANLPVTKKRRAVAKALASSSTSAPPPAELPNEIKPSIVSADSSRGNLVPGVITGISHADNQDISVPEPVHADCSPENDVSASLPPAKVKCTMCYKSFATKERLDRHMIVHSDEDTKPLKCPFCPKRFLTNSALAGHIKTHAEEGKCFECPICTFSTQQLLQLKEHVQTHKNRDSGLFHCPQCPKKFSAYSMIRKHIRAFHGPRQYSCDACPMSFPTSDKLKLHKLKHSDHREFLCAECGRQFKRKDKLREHTKRIHETKRKTIELIIPKDSKLKKTFLPKISAEEYERYTYKCSECMVGFKRRGMLVNHLAKRHPEKRPQQVPELAMPIVRPTRNYFCLYCDRVYKSSSKRKAHILKAHPGKPVPPQARSKEISPQMVATFVDPQPLQPGTVVQTLTDDSNNTARAGVVSSVSKVSTTQIAAAVRRETVVGKVVAQPHGCTWCHRQYATRAKLLQHQRKAHIHLMPEDMQLPRTQKNNVMRKQESKSSKSKKSDQDSVISSNVIAVKSDPMKIAKSTSNVTSTVNTASVVVSQSSSAAQPSSSTSSQPTPSDGTSSTTTTTLQALSAEGLPFTSEDGNLVGILVAQVGSNVELGNLVSSDVPIVMLTTQPVAGSPSGTTSAALSALSGVNFSVLQTTSSTADSPSSSNIASSTRAVIQHSSTPSTDNSSSTSSGVISSTPKL